MPVTLSDLLHGFLWADARGSGAEFRASICRQTGKIYYYTDYDSGEVEEPLPDDIYDRGKYLRIPDKCGLDLGKPLVLDFAREHLPGRLRRDPGYLQPAARLPKIQIPARQARRHRPLARVRGQGDRARLARLVRAARDRDCRLIDTHEVVRSRTRDRAHVDFGETDTTDAFSTPST
jgi:hypothetical protein